MKNINLYILVCVIYSLAGCSTKEATYNAATYVINKECATTKNCSGGFNSTYQENEKSNAEYQKLLSKEQEAARLKKVQQELESKEKQKKTK